MSETNKEHLTECFWKERAERAEAEVERLMGIITQPGGAWTERNRERALADELAAALKKTAGVVSHLLAWERRALDKWEEARR